MGFTGEGKKTFLATVERYNQLYEQGEDEDFGKPMYRMSSVSQPPFYAARIAGTMLATMHGIITNVNSQPVREDGSVVEGLYVCGNDQGGFYPHNYPSNFTASTPAARPRSPASPPSTSAAWSSGSRGALARRAGPGPTRHSRIERCRIRVCPCERAARRATRAGKVWVMPDRDHPCALTRGEICAICETAKRASFGASLFAFGATARCS